MSPIHNYPDSGAHTDGAIHTLRICLRHQTDSKGGGTEDDDE